MDKKEEAHLEHLNLGIPSNIKKYFMYLFLSTILMFSSCVSNPKEELIGVWYLNQIIEGNSVSKLNKGGTLTFINEQNGEFTNSDDFTADFNYIKTDSIIRFNVISKYFFTSEKEWQVKIDNVSSRYLSLTLTSLNGNKKYIFTKGIKE